jgi:hypothetical protein
MTEYRLRETGEIKSATQLRLDNKTISLPKVWNDEVHEALGVDPVLVTAKPKDGIEVFQQVVRNGVEQLEDGTWAQAWLISDMFADDPELGTKAQQETQYQSLLDAEQAEVNRNYRDRLMYETDWWATSDRTMTAEQTAYRQLLRDISSHANWPHLDEADWPTKP